MKFSTKLLIGSLLVGFAPYTWEHKENGDYTYNSLFVNVKKETHETEDGDYAVTTFSEPPVVKGAKKLGELACGLWNRFVPGKPIGCGDEEDEAEETEDGEAEDAEPEADAEEA